MIMIESVRLLAERLETLTTPNDTRQHLPANIVGMGLYNQLVEDHAMDAGLFKDCIEYHRWVLEKVGSSEYPMFTLLFTDKGMITLPNTPKGNTVPEVEAWAREYDRRRRTPTQKLIDRVKSWFR